MSIKPNDPAFPAPGTGEWNDPETCKQWRDYTGMSLRAYFAGQAMQSILQATISADLHASAQTPPDDVIVKWAVSVADALIAELNKTQ